METKAFSVETKAGSFKSISFRTRWLLGEQNASQFPMRAAEGHAECRGRVACGHAECRGRVACGNPSAARTEGDSGIANEELGVFYKRKLGKVPSKGASIFKLLESKSKLLSAQSVFKAWKVFTAVL